MANRFSQLPVRMMLGLARFHRGLTLGVRAAVFDADSRVFLVRHSYTPGWYLPGGAVEPGETLAEALDRELMEEGGIVLGRPAELFGVYFNRELSRRDHVALFLSRDWAQPKPPKVPNLEIRECGFFAPDALPEGATAATIKRLAEIREGAAASAEW